MKHSPGMAELIDRGGVTLLSGSHFHSEPSPQAFALWERARRPMCTLISGPGAFLDVGCANGFLLRCVAEWTPHQIIPFGIDIDPELVAHARGLLGDPTRVRVQDMGEGDPLTWFGRRFQTIYWNVGENLTFESPEEVDIVKRLQRGLVNIGGTLILGFYEQDMESSREKVRRLESNGFTNTRSAEGLFALFVTLS